MRFTVDRDTFARHTVWLVKHLPARPAVPILDGMRISIAADAPAADLLVFDYEQVASARIPVGAVDRPGASRSSRPERWPGSSTPFP